MMIDEYLNIYKLLSIGAVSILEPGLEHAGSIINALALHEFVPGACVCLGIIALIELRVLGILLLRHRVQRFGKSNFGVRQWLWAWAQRKRESFSKYT